MPKTAFIIENDEDTLDKINAVLAAAGIKASLMPCGLESARKQFSEPADCVRLARKASELEKAHQRLKWSEARMRHFARIAADWFWETDEDGRIIWSSDGPIEEGEQLDAAFSGALKGIVPGELCDQTLAAFKEGRPFQHAVLELEQDSGERLAFRLSGEPLIDEFGFFSGFRGVGHDISDALRASRQPREESSQDELTGLPNQKEFRRRLLRAWFRARQEGARHALCYIDLDHFKTINDLAGHAAGDVLLARLADVMRGLVRGADTLARLHGDEFCILLENCAQDFAVQFCENLVETLRGLDFEWNGAHYAIGASIGITLVTQATEDASRAMAEADIACYAAKKLGRGQVQMFRQHDAGGHKAE